MNFPNNGAPQVPQDGPSNFSAHTHEGDAGGNAPEVDLKLSALMVDQMWRLQGKFLPVMLAKQVAQEKTTKDICDLLKLLIKRQDEEFVLLDQRCKHLETELQRTRELCAAATRIAENRARHGFDSTARPGSRHASGNKPRLAVGQDRHFWSVMEG